MKECRTHQQLYRLLRPLHSRFESDEECSMTLLHCFFPQTPPLCHGYVYRWIGQPKSRQCRQNCASSTLCSDPWHLHCSLSVQRKARERRTKKYDMNSDVLPTERQNTNVLICLSMFSIATKQQERSSNPISQVRSDIDPEELVLFNRNRRPLTLLFDGGTQQDRFSFSIDDTSDSRNLTTRKSSAALLCVCAGYDRHKECIFLN